MEAKQELVIFDVEPEERTENGCNNDLTEFAKYIGKSLREGHKMTHLH